MIGQQSFHRFTEHTYTTPDALCAELAAIRARGYAFDRQEHEPGIICIAQPILTDRGRVLGALPVIGSTETITVAHLEMLAPRLEMTAQQNERDAQAWP